MEMLIVLATISAFCIALYLFGGMVSKKAKGSREVFAAGKHLPVIRPKYFHHLYLTVLLFLVFDATVLIIATSSTFGTYARYFLGVILLVSVLIGLELKNINVGR